MCETSAACKRLLYRRETSSRFLIVSSGFHKVEENWSDLDLSLFPFRSFFFCKQVQVITRGVFLTPSCRMKLLPPLAFVTLHRWYQFFWHDLLLGADCTLTLAFLFHRLCRSPSSRIPTFWKAYRQISRRGDKFARNIDHDQYLNRREFDKKNAPVRKYIESGPRSTRRSFLEFQGVRSVNALSKRRTWFQLLRVSGAMAMKGEAPGSSSSFPQIADSLLARLFLPPKRYLSCIAVRCDFPWLPSPHQALNSRFRPNIGNFLCSK